MDEALGMQAREAGVEIEVKKCAFCLGEGELSHADPLDLKRLRERHVSVTPFASSVWNPEKQKQGVSIGFISMVENGSRRCPDWLLREYLAIPEKTWPARPTAPQNSNEAMQRARDAKGRKGSE